jgi:Protein of unknown function (DUF3592)
MPDQNTIWLIVSILFLATAAALWVRKRIKLRHARDWPTETGRVDSSSVHLETAGGQPGAAAFYAQVKYSYAVQGQSFSGALRRKFMLKGRADKWIGRYTNGVPLTVRYNPADPKDSVLFEDEQAGIPSLRQRR